MSAATATVPCVHCDGDIVLTVDVPAYGVTHIATKVECPECGARQQVTTRLRPVAAS
jgi:hypothetical protein